LKINIERNVYLHRTNAEDLLPDVIALIKKQAESDSRIKAFEDCSTYWGREVMAILNSEVPDQKKLEGIRKMFSYHLKEEKSNGKV
jgi:hypothetical protein